MMPKCALTGIAVVLLYTSTASCAVIDLFNGEDLSGFTVHGNVPWVVEDGILRNTETADAYSFLQYDSFLPSSNFTLETRVRVVDGMRFRLHAAFDELYVGNEGYWYQFEVYGNHIFDVTEVGDDSYVLGQWYDLRLEVDAEGGVKLFKGDVLTHTANVSPLSDLQVTLVPGDGWSAGMIEVQSLRYTYPVPEPASLAMWLLLGMVGLGYGWRLRKFGSV